MRENIFSFSINISFFIVKSKQFFFFFYFARSSIIKSIVTEVKSREIFFERITRLTPRTKHFNLVHAMVTPFGEPINDNNSTRLPFGISPAFILRNTIISRPTILSNMFNWHFLSFLFLKNPLLSNLLLLKLILTQMKHINEKIIITNVTSMRNIL